MTITKVKPPSSKPVGVSFSHKCHNVRWVYRLKYIAAILNLRMMPFTKTILESTAIKIAHLV